MTELDDITLKEFELLCDLEHACRVKADALEEQLKAVRENLSQAQYKIIAYLKQYEKNSYKTRHGNYIIQQRWTTSMPKDPEDREKFFGYLKDKGIFEHLITVNHQTLNSWFKQEFEAAKDEQNFDFKVPGLSEPKVFETLSLRSTK